MRQEHAFENLGDEGQIATKLKGCNRGVTVTTDLPTLFTTASHNVAYDIGLENADCGRYAHERAEHGLHTCWDPRRA
jgi:4-hydroxy-L-threonine phosphate dehydrogenase PdxA